MRKCRLVCFGIGLGLVFVFASARGAHAWNSNQGTRLLGDAPRRGGDSVVWFPKTGWRRKDGVEFRKVQVEKGMLVPYGESGRLSPHELIEATVEARSVGGRTIKYRVKRMNQPPYVPGLPSIDLTNSTYYYTLVTADTGSLELPYCARSPRIWVGERPYPVDADRGVQAVPVAEVWNSTGTEGLNEQHFTMACMAGAVAKCYRWGYQSWRGGPNAQAYVQACTRMAMADYCGDGHSHTLEGTPINLYDLGWPTAVNPPPIAPAGSIPPSYRSDWPDLQMMFETAWTGGAGRLPYLTSWTTPAARGGALCLSKKRWDSIPLGGKRPGGGAPLPGSCPRLANQSISALPDPRVGEKSPIGRRPGDAYRRGEFCDYFADGQVDHDRLTKAGALIFNGSPYLDSTLSLWIHETTFERWTTAAKVDSGRHLATHPTGYRPRSLQLGSALSVRTPPPVLEWLPRLVPLYSYFNPLTGDNLTSTMTQPPNGYFGGTVQGLIHPCMKGRPRPRGSVPLYRYHQAAPTDHYTTIVAIDGVPRYCASDPAARNWRR